MSLAKQNFATASEEAINQQINTELQASQVYLSMSAWAQHTSVALPGLEKYFREQAHEVHFCHNICASLTHISYRNVNTPNISLVNRSYVTRRRLRLDLTYEQTT